MLFNIVGKRILVTGSTSGLGLLLAEGLANAGASVVLNGRTFGSELFDSLTVPKCFVYDPHPLLLVFFSLPDLFT